MANISKVKLPDGVTYNVKDSISGYATQSYVDSAIAAMPEPMVFKGTLGTSGTITSLPTAAASNEGFTYKVITAGTYASQAAKVGDVFISTGSAWVLLPSGDEPSGTVTNVAISNGGGIGVSGSPITSSGTITLTNAGVRSITQDSSDGHKLTVNTNGSTSTITIPDNNTHYTTHLYAGSGTAANASTTNGNTKLTVTDDSTVRNSVTLKGTGTTTVTSDASGNITINSGNTTYSDMTAATSSAAGAHGLVPAPAAGKQDSFLRGNATWADASTVLNTLSTGSSDPTDNDYYISQYAGGGTSTTTYHRRPVSALWNYIKGKIAVSNSKPTLSWGTTSTVGSVAGTSLQVTMPANPNTDTKVTAVGNHYTPSGGSATTPSSSGTATRGSTVVMTGITKDAAGHITGVTGYTLPASDNTDTKVSQSESTTSSWRNLLMGYNTISTPTGAVGSATNVIYGSVGVAAQPSTGTIRATQYNVADGVSLVYDSTNKCLNFNFA